MRAVSLDRSPVTFFIAACTRGWWIFHIGTSTASASHHPAGRPPLLPLRLALGSGSSVNSTPSISASAPGSVAIPLGRTNQHTCVGGLPPPSITVGLWLKVPGGRGASLSQTLVSLAPK